MRTFISEDKFVIAGRGDVYVMRAKEDIPATDLQDKSVMIDGKEFICRGIERFINRLGDPFIFKGESFSLLVEEIK